MYLLYCHVAEFHATPYCSKERLAVYLNSTFLFIFMTNYYFCGINNLRWLNQIPYCPLQISLAVSLTMSEQQVHPLTAQCIIIRFLAPRFLVFSWRKKFNKGRERIENEKHDCCTQISITENVCTTYTLKPHHNINRLVTLKINQTNSAQRQ